MTARGPYPYYRNEGRSICFDGQDVQVVVSTDGTAKWQSAQANGCLRALGLPREAGIAIYTATDALLSISQWTLDRLVESVGPASGTAAQISPTPDQQQEGARPLLHSEELDSPQDRVRQGVLFPYRSGYQTYLQDDGAVFVRESPSLRWQELHLPPETSQPIRLVRSLTTNEIVRLAGIQRELGSRITANT